MADFQEQAMGLTGLTIDGSSTAPSRAEFSTFLNDGVIDVTSRWLATKPQDIDKFTRESVTTASNGFDTTGAQIIAVIREAGADGDTDGSTAWEPCRKVPVQMQSRVVDIDSLSYASKYNPVYIIDSNGLLNVYPIPDGTDDGYRVFYVNNSPEETDGSALDHASTGIKWFPASKVYLVVLYASMKSLQAKIGSTTVPSISNLNISAIVPVAPAGPDFTTIASFTPTQSGKLSQTGSSGSSSQGAAGTNAASVDATGADWDAMLAGLAPPMYAPPVAPNFTTQMTAEDTELAQLELQKYQTDIQNELNRYNQQNAIYQKETQARLLWYESIARKGTTSRPSSSAGGAGASVTTDGMAPATATTLSKKADLMFQKELQDFTLRVQIYQGKVGSYQQEVVKEVQEYTTNLQKEVQLWQTEVLQYQAMYTQIKAEYDGAYGTATAPQQQTAQTAQRANRRGR